MPTHLKKIVQGLLPPREMQLLTGSYDIAGDIALVRIADCLAHRAALIGEAILQTNCKLKVVVRRTGKHTGEFRTADLEVIAGEQRTETEVREFGLTYQLDFASCYFSIRSGAERRRIASCVQPGERVLVLFSGVAPFPLMIARHSSAAEVVGVEKNYDAHAFAVKNCATNHLTKRVHLYCADAASLPQEITCGRRFHRLVMPLPVGGEPFLAAALALLVPGGILHFYRMAKCEEKELVAENLQREIALHGRQIENISIVKTGHCGNRLFRYSFEGKIL